MVSLKDFIMRTKGENPKLPDGEVKRLAKEKYDSYLAKLKGKK